jgi:N4-gp56 family major capsid protein
MQDGTPRQIQFPKKGSGIAVTWGVSPGATVAPSTFPYDALTVTVQKAGMRLDFTTEALEQALRDVIKDHVYEGGIVYAETIDDVACSIMLGLTTTTATVASSLGTFANTPVFKIVSVGANTVSSVNYTTGVVTMSGSLAATVTAQYISGRTYVSASSAGSLTVKDIQRAKAKMVTNHIHPDVLLFNEADYASLLFDTNAKFIDYTQYGGKEPVLNGELGKLIGLKVISSTRIPQGNAILVDTKRLGYDVHKRELNGVREDKPEFDSVWYVADTLAVAVVVNAQSADYVYKAA